MQKLLREYVRCLVKEEKLADTSTGEQVPWGSPEHIRDLKARIEDLTCWRDKHRKGTARRADYSRLVNGLKAELASAERAAQKRIAAAEKDKISAEKDKIS